MEDRAGTVGDGPDFRALAASPPLQRTVVALHDDARRWRDAHDRADAESGAPYELVRSIAERTITRHGVSPGQVNGIVFVIPVDGSWWRPAGPGVVVSSSAGLRDEATAADLLREVFETGLER